MSSEYRRGLASSRYQSHSSDQNDSYSSSVARENSNESSSREVLSVRRSSRETIQRSSTVSAAAGSASASGSTPSSTSREAFHSLFARSRPCWTRCWEKRTSWVEDMASRPKRRASAPCSSISSIGSMPVPSDLDMRRPSGAWITEWIGTSVNGTVPVNSIPNMIIRATQR